MTFLIPIFPLATGNTLIAFPNLDLPTPVSPHRRGLLSCHCSILLSPPQRDAKSQCMGAFGRPAHTHPSYPVSSPACLSRSQIPNYRSADLIFPGYVMDSWVRLPCSMISIRGRLVHILNQFGINPRCSELRFATTAHKMSVFPFRRTLSSHQHPPA